MRRSRPYLSAVLLVVATLLLVAIPASAREAAHSDRLVMGKGSTSTQAGVANAPRPCQDSAHRLLGGKWQGGNYAWSFEASSTPARLNHNAVLNVLKKSFSNVTNASNDCGLRDNVSATHTYLGTTRSRTKCAKRDHHNVVGFRRLPFGVLAVTCYWMQGNRIVEADMQINSRENWALALTGCHRQPFLESTITHEAGHVFGLAHVGERRHGRLTMSPFMDGPCNSNEASLGLGDVRGLEALY